MLQSVVQGREGEQKAAGCKHSERDRVVHTQVRLQAVKMDWPANSEFWSGLRRMVAILRLLHFLPALDNHIIRGAHVKTQYSGKLSFAYLHACVPPLMALMNRG